MKTLLVTEDRSRLYFSLTWMLVVAGVVLRLAFLMHNRCFWNDELAVALAWQQPTLSGLLTELGARSQIAPVGFLLLVKAATGLFGESEWCFRLVPFLASVVGLILFRELVTRWFQPATAVVSLSLICLNLNLVEYANELKPYAVDQMVATGLILLMFYGHHRHWRGYSFLFLAVAGVVAPWLSFPSTLLLAVIGLYVFVFMLRARQYGRSIITAVVGVCWLISFGLEYRMVNSVAQSDYMHTFWADQFLPFPPGSLSDLLWLPHSLTSLFRNPLTTTVKQLSVVLCLYGWFRCWRMDRTMAVVLCGPIVLALAVSAAHLYPFGDRLAQYLVPTLAIGVALGVQPLFERSSRWQWIGAGVLALTLIEPAARSCRYAWSGPVHEESQPVLKHIADQWQDGDVLYIQKNSNLSVEYYADDAGLPAENRVRGKSLMFATDSTVKSVIGSPRVWVYFGHAMPEDVAGFLDQLDRFGPRLDTISTPGCTACLYDLTPRVGAIGGTVPK